MVLPPAEPEDVEDLPADVALVHAFVNTLDQREYVVHGRRMKSSDAWQDPAALERWLHEHRLPTGEGRVTPTDLDRARQLRALLRDSTRQTGPAAVQPITGFPLLASAGTGAGLRLTSPAGGVDAELARVLITALDLSSRGLWARLKMCLADDCHWIFFDRSRPGRGRWCSPQLCGNRLKTRAYRQRREPQDSIRRAR